MKSSCLFALDGRELGLREIDLPLDLDTLVPGEGPWEVEIGFGKGRYLLHRAVAEPERRFLGLEVAGKYHRIMAQRAHRRRARNLVALRAEALSALAVVLPVRFATAVHVYFPDPWPKQRHNRRRLFDPTTIDLVVGLLRPGGRIFFATDSLEYGDLVEEILQSHPGLGLQRRESPWEDGARTNYEAKYMAEGRRIRRLVAIRDGGSAAGWSTLHPRGCEDVVVAYRRSGRSEGPLWAS